MSNRACLKNCLKVDFFFTPFHLYQWSGSLSIFCLFVLLSVYHSVFKYSLFAFNPWTIELKVNSNNLTRILLTTNCSNCSTKQAVIFKKHKNIFFPVEQVLTHEVKGGTYVPHLVEQYSMEVRVTALIKESGAIYIKSDEFRLRRPDLSFEVHYKNLVSVSKNLSPKTNYSGNKLLILLSRVILV